MTTTSTRSPASPSEPCKNCTTDTKRILHDRRLTVVAVVTLLLLPAAVLFPFRHAGFVADDILFTSPEYGGGVRSILTSPWQHPLGKAQGYRPLVSLSYVLNQHLFGMEPTGWHITNFVLHGMASALVALLGIRMGGSRTLGLLAGSLFALHPIHHENVI